MFNKEVLREANTKRPILSQSLKVFHPLSLCLPVTMRSMRKLWPANLDWDETITIETQKTWYNLAEDLASLSYLAFPRYSVDQDKPMNLCIFCDVSADAYGFVVYGVQNTKSSISFSKAKVAPVKSKTLPTLELLGVYLAVKCLPTLLKAYSHIKIDNIYLFIDTEVVLLWIISDKIQTKNLYTRNRINI